MPEADWVRPGVWEALRGPAGQQALLGSYHMPDTVSGTGIYQETQ